MVRNSIQVQGIKLLDEAPLVEVYHNLALWSKRPDFSEPLFRRYHMDGNPDLGLLVNEDRVLVIGSAVKQPYYSTLDVSFFNSLESIQRRAYNPLFKFTDSPLYEGEFDVSWINPKQPLETRIGLVERFFN